MSNECSRCSWPEELQQQMFSVAKQLSSKLFLPALAICIQLGTVATFLTLGGCYFTSQMKCLLLTPDSISYRAQHLLHTWFMFLLHRHKLPNPHTLVFSSVKHLPPFQSCT